MQVTASTTIIVVYEERLSILYRYLKHVKYAFKGKIPL